MPKRRMSIEMAGGVPPKLLGERLRALRELRGLSQPRISQLTGMSQTARSALERGEISSPTFHDMVLLARALGIDPNHMAALAGLWEVEEDDPPELRQAFDEIRRLARRESEDSLRELIVVLRALVSVWRQRHEARTPAGDGGKSELLSKLPSWARTIG